MLATSSAHAGGGAATDAYEGIDDKASLDVHGLADIYLQQAFDQGVPGRTELRAFDTWTGVASPNLVRLTLAHAPSPVGFRIDVGVGDLPDAYLRADPAASSYPTLSRGLSYVEQAFVTLEVPAGRGISVDVGKFGTPVGLEDNETPTNWSYSRGLLFTLAEPTYHAGLRLTYSTSDKLAVSVFWLNGWNSNTVGGDGMRSFAGAVTWKPTDHLELVLTYIAGLERALDQLASPALSFRSEVSSYATYDATGKWSLALAVDQAFDASGGGVTWDGAGLYTRYQLVPWLAGAARCEYFTDPEGFATGTRQQVEEATVTLATKHELDASPPLGKLSVMTRLEYRRDQSSAPVFETTATPRTRQDTLTFAIIASF